MFNIIIKEGRRLVGKTVDWTLEPYESSTDAVLKGAVKGVILAVVINGVLMTSQSYIEAGNSVVKAVKKLTK